MSPRKLPRHLVWLESFVTSVETGSLDAAAEHLGVARSVVSEHLKALEATLAGGAALLERGAGRRLQLTPRGERVYEGALTPLRQLGVRRLRDLAADEPPLRLGVNPTVSNVLLADLAKDAAARALPVEVSFLGSHELVRRAQQSQIDLALGFTPLPPHRGVESLALHTMPFAVLAAPGCELVERVGRKRTVDISDLAGLAFVDWLREDPYGEANAARFAAEGISVREVARVESFLQLYDFLRAFEACTIAPDLTGLGDLPPDLHAWRLNEEAPQSVALVALWPSRGLSTGAEALLTGLSARLAARR